SVMRLASSWMVITSGMITSRMTLSRGCTTPAWRSFSRSRRRRSEASERSRWASSKALLMVSLMRSRRSSPVLTGLFGGLAPLFLLGLGVELRLRSQRLEALALGRFRLGALLLGLERAPARIDLVGGKAAGPLHHLREQTFRLLRLGRFGIAAAGRGNRTLLLL